MSPEQYEPDPDDWGPRVEVSGQYDTQVGVVRPYQNRGGQGPVWSGRVGFYRTGDLFMEMEVSLLASTKGPAGSHFVAMPQRSYQAQGQTKYQRLVYLRGDGWAPAMQEAIERWLKGERGRVFTPVDDVLKPFPSTSEQQRYEAGDFNDMERREAEGRTR